MGIVLVSSAIDHGMEPNVSSAIDRGMEPWSIKPESIKLVFVQFLLC